MTYETGVVVFLSLLLMARCTIIHLHPVPGIFAVTSDISSPNIDAILGEPINLEYW